MAEPGNDMSVLLENPYFPSLHCHLGLFLLLIQLFSVPNSFSLPSISYVPVTMLGVLLHETTE